MLKKFRANVLKRDGSFKWATEHNEQDRRQKKRFGGKFNFFITCYHYYALYLSFRSVDVAGK